MTLDEETTAVLRPRAPLQRDTALVARIDIRTVSGRLGHANASTTLDIYAQFVEQTDDRARSSSEVNGRLGDLAQMAARETTRSASEERW